MIKSRKFSQKPKITQKNPQKNPKKFPANFTFWLGGSHSCEAKGLFCLYLPLGNVC